MPVSEAFTEKLSFLGLISFICLYISLTSLFEQRRWPSWSDFGGWLIQRSKWPRNRRAGRSSKSDLLNKIKYRVFQRWTDSFPDFDPNLTGRNLFRASSRKSDAGLSSKCQVEFSGFSSDKSTDAFHMLSQMLQSFQAAPFNDRYILRWVFMKLNPQRLILNDLHSSLFSNSSGPAFEVFDDNITVHNSYLGAAFQVSQ